MNSKEIQLYLGIIVPNTVALLFLGLVVILEAPIHYLRNFDFILFLVISGLVMSLLSVFFWQGLNMKLRESLTYQILNILVLLFWISVLIF